ncbi:hypothetical protein [Streptomyces sp. NPDC048473]
MTAHGRDGQEAVVELEYQPTTADFVGRLNARAKVNRNLQRL